jgi:hypothetical protein
MNSFGHFDRFVRPNVFFSSGLSCVPPSSAAFNLIRPVRSMLALSSATSSGIFSLLKMPDLSAAATPPTWLPQWLPPLWLPATSRSTRPRVPIPCVPRCVPGSAHQLTHVDAHHLAINASCLDGIDWKRDGGKRFGDPVSSVLPGYPNSLLCAMAYRPRLSQQAKLATRERNDSPPGTRQLLRRTFAQERSTDAAIRLYARDGLLNGTQQFSLSLDIGMALHMADVQDLSTPDRKITRDLQSRARCVQAPEPLASLSGGLPDGSGGCFVAAEMNSLIVQPFVHAWLGWSSLRGA